MIEKKCTRVKSSLLLQDVYVRDVVQAKDLCSSYPKKVYSELQRKTTSNGIVEELVEVDYPHTPEVIKSYAPSADYHSDVVGAIASATPKANLGDVSVFQDILSRDMSEARSLYEGLKSVFESKPAAESAAKPAAEPAEGGISE